MDFRKVLELILKRFNQEDVRYGLIGGFALGILGAPRSTVDLDFLVHREDLDKIDKIMKSTGYERAFKSENVSQYVSSLKIFGEIDFLHAFRKASVGMLNRVVEKEIFDGALKLKVLRPEDIIGLKVQAVANDAKRAAQEYTDIEAVMECQKQNLDWQLLEDYFSLFNQEAKFAELKARYYEVK